MTGCHCSECMALAERDWPGLTTVLRRQDGYSYELFCMRCRESLTVSSSKAMSDEALSSVMIALITVAGWCLSDLAMAGFPGKLVPVLMGEEVLCPACRE